MKVVRVLAAVMLLAVAATSPVIGLAAADEYTGRKLYGVLEGDWLFWFALIAGGATVWAAITLLRHRP